MDGGGDVRDVTVGWFLGRLRILEERMRSSEEEIAQMRQEHSLLLRRLGEKGAEFEGLAGENPSPTNENSETSACDTDFRDDDNPDAKWAISVELSDLVVKTPISTWNPPQVMRTMSDPEKTPRPLSNVLTHRSSAPPKLYSWEDIMEKDRIRAEAISKLNQKYKWFTRAAEGLAERMMKAKQLSREASEASDCVGNDMKEQGLVASATGRIPTFPTVAVIQSADAPATKLFKKRDQESNVFSSWQEPKIYNGKVEDCKMKHLTDRFRIHWNATFASATLITESTQSIGAPLSPRNICSETPSLGNSKQQQNHTTSFLLQKPKLLTSTTAIRKSASFKNNPFYSKTFITGVNRAPYDTKIGASLEYTHILKTIKESDDCLTVD